MNEYEITYIVSPEVAEGAREELNTAIDAKVAELGGSVGGTSPTLRRKLMYPIKNTQSAFLRTMHIRLAPEHIRDMREQLIKTDGVLRASVLATPHRDSAQAKLAEQQEQRTLAPATKDAKPAKDVTMEDVEKGIEEALTEKIK